MTVPLLGHGQVDKDFDLENLSPGDAVAVRMDDPQLPAICTIIVERIESILLQFRFQVRIVGYYRDQLWRVRVRATFDPRADGQRVHPKQKCGGQPASPSRHRQRAAQLSTARRRR